MRIRFEFVVPLLVALSACGGGGAGDNADQSVPFSSFASVQPGQTVSAIGLSQTQNVTLDSSGTVATQLVNPADQNGVNVRWTYGSGSPLVLTGIQFDVPRPGASVTWNNGRGNQVVTCGNPLCSASGDGATGVLANAPGTLGWNFQTFGYWLAGTIPSADIAAGISAGRRTGIAGVPMAGGVITYNASPVAYM